MWSSVGWIFGRPSDLGCTFRTDLFVRRLVRAYIVWAIYLFLDTSLKTKYVIQRRLDFLQAVRFERYVSNKLV